MAKIVSDERTCFTSKNEFTNGLFWILKVWGSNTVAIIKNTQKEELEANLIKSWEHKEPGRAERAALVRQRQLLLCKKMEGKPLTDKELQLLNEDPNKNGFKASAKQPQKPAKPPVKDQKPGFIQPNFEYLDNPAKFVITKLS